MSVSCDFILSFSGIGNNQSFVKTDDTVKMEIKVDPSSPLECELDTISDDTFSKETLLNMEKDDNAEFVNGEYSDHDENAAIKEIKAKAEVFTGVDYENYFEEKEKERYKDSIAKHLEELKGKTLSKPSNKREEKVYQIFLKGIQYEKAKLDLLTGKIKSLNAACKVHGGLSGTTLQRLFKEKKNFLGHSKNAIKVFTNREEQTIIDEFVQRNNGVKEYERKSLQRVIWEKIQDIKNSNPERDFSKYVSGNGVFRKGFAYKLAKKFGLSSRRTDKEQKYECEICYTSYTLMSSLKKHLRKVHFL